jgi:hypothetical protein
VVLVLALVPPAHADPREVALDRTAVGHEMLIPRERPILRRWRIPLVIAESAAVLAVPMTYYWNTTDLQREDWEMRWDWPSWKEKLTTFDALILDTGYWEANAIRHPIAGAFSYQVARANGFLPGASTGIDLLTAVTWEYLVEFKEKVSVNDIIVNTVTGFLLGEPLFQIGMVADARDASWARKTLGWITSPAHRLHATAGYSSWRHDQKPWSELEVGLGGRAATLGGVVRAETALGLDLEVVGGPYGRAGSGARWTRPGMWNRVTGEVSVSEAGLSRAWLQTMTTYAGRYVHDIDPTGTGTDSFIGAAAGIDYESRQLANEWDHVLVLHLIGPRVAAGRWHGDRSLSWDAAAYGDLGMVQAHVFGPVPPFETMPQRSVLQSRGYYYATGLTVETRLRADARPWFVSFEARAHQLWSIDGYDRVELDGAPGDPGGVSDQRLSSHATFGLHVRPGLRLELAADAALRRGTWQDHERVSGEAGTGAGVVIDF